MGSNNENDMERCAINIGVISVFLGSFLCDCDLFLSLHKTRWASDGVHYSRHLLVQVQHESSSRNWSFWIRGDYSCFWLEL